jgi:signal transduction histidine kinase
MIVTINAIQGMPDGGTLTVGAAPYEIEENAASAWPPGQYVCVTFRDSGTGIPEDIKPRIFDCYMTTKPATASAWPSSTP